MTSDEQPARRTRWQHPVLLGAIALATAAAAVAVWFGIALANASTDDSLDRARVRDEVDRVARQAIITFNTLDYRKADEGLDKWLAVSTGDLHNEVAGRRESGKKAIEAAKNVTTAEVLSLAITDLNEFDGTATLIATVKVVVTPEGKQPTPKWLPIQGALQRTPDGWKLSNLGQVNFANN